MNYQIMQQVEGKRFVPVPELVYPNAAAAAVAARKMTKESGIKFQPRPVAEGEAWKIRERKRLADGSYKPPIWAGLDWFEKNQRPDHFLHISVKDPTRIAFTKSDSDGAKDIQTAMKPGKYLTEFFGGVLTPEQIRTYSMDHSMTFENKELKFAATPEDIERVYKPNLGYSCFSGTTKANLYGSGDFAVAYFEKDGEIKARAVCCPERKIFIRPYGDDCRLRKLLADLGYKEESGKAWRGLRLLKEHYWQGFYSDFGCRATPHPTEPDKYYVTT